MKLAILIVMLAALAGCIGVSIQPTADGGYKVGPAATGGF